MGKVSVAEIKELMTATGVGMMDCKKALVEADGDMEKAVTLLREKGLATQAKKSGRVAAVADTVIETNPADVDALKATKISGGDKTVEETLQDLFIKIRENMVIRRFKRMEGILVPYVHGAGSIGVMVKLDSDIAADNAELLAAGKDCALQVAAMNPAYLNREAVPADALDKEREIMLAQMAEDPKMANKPEQVKHKIIDGKIGKYYSENCLLEQAFVKDDKVSVGKYVESVAKKLGGKIDVVEYVRFERGEGVEKKEENFADEVAAMTK